MNLSKITIAALLILLILVIFFNGCGKPRTIYITPKIDTKPIWKAINDKVAEIMALKELGRAQDSVRTVYRDRWHKAKTDTVRLTKTQIINSCDSALAKDSLAMITKDKTIAGQDTLIAKLWQLRSADSTNHRMEVDSLKMVNKGLKRKLWRTRAIAAAIAVKDAVKYGLELGK